MFEQWCSFCNERGLPVLKICVSNLGGYLGHHEVTHHYAYTTLCMHASAICSILQPTEQTRASTAPLVICHQPESGMSGRSQTYCMLGKAFSLELHSSIPEEGHDLGPHHSLEAIRYELIKDYSRSYAENGGLSYLQTSVWTKNARPNQPYGPAITLR